MGMQNFIKIYQKVQEIGPVALFSEFEPRQNLLDYSQMSFDNLIGYILSVLMCKQNFITSLFQNLESKTISNDQELIQSDPTSCPQTKREITKYINWQQFTKGTRGKPNEQLFPRQVVIQVPKIY